MPHINTINLLIHDLIDEINLRDEKDCVLKKFTSQPDIFTLFEESVFMKPDEIFQNYQNLAIKQYQSAITYSNYTDFIQLFTTKLINKAAIIINDTVLIEHINYLANIVINATAKGYLLELINGDIPTINAQLEEYVAIQHINAHIHWMKRIIYDIEDGAQIASVELNPQKCQFGLWAATNELANFFSPQELQNINHMHHAVHNSGKSIYYHLKHKKYHQVLVDYLFLSRMSINLVSKLNIKITRQLLQEQIETDSLTKLRNRHSLERILKKTLSFYNKDKETFSLAMLDIDFFKKINDTYGHQVGDMVLQKIAQLLKENIRESDMIFRYGGEEFLLLLPQCDEKCAQIACEKLRTSIENHTFDAPLQNYTITLSIGISTAKKAPLSTKEIIEKADNNLYLAKERGRNQVISS